MNCHICETSIITLQRGDRTCKSCQEYVCKRHRNGFGTCKVCADKHETRAATKDRVRVQDLGRKLNKTWNLLDRSIELTEEIIECVRMDSEIEADEHTEQLGLLKSSLLKLKEETRNV